MTAPTLSLSYTESGSPDHPRPQTYSKPKLLALLLGRSRTLHPLSYTARPNKPPETRRSNLRATRQIILTPSSYRTTSLVETRPARSTPNPKPVNSKHLIKPLNPKNETQIPPKPKNPNLPLHRPLSQNNSKDARRTLERLRQQRMKEFMEGASFDNSVYRVFLLGAWGG